MTSPFPPLVTEDMLEGLRSYAYQGLQTEVTLLRRMVSSNIYGDDQEDWVEIGTTWGWIRQMNDPAIAEALGLASTIGIFRLELPVDTDAEPGDMVGLEGKTYTVQNTNIEDTLKIWLEAFVRIIE